MKPTIAALGMLILLGSMPVLAQEHQHSAPAGSQAEVAPPVKAPVPKQPMSEKMTEMKGKMAEKMKAKEGSFMAGKGMMKSPPPRESSAPEK